VFFKPAYAARGLGEVAPVQIEREKLTTSYPAFSSTEYAERIARTRSAIEAQGIEALIVSDPPNMGWLTGNDGWSFYVHQAVVLGPEGQPLWWDRAMDALGVRRTVFMDEERIFGYENSFVQNPDKHPMAERCRLIAGEGWGGARIGVEMDNYYFSATAFQAGLGQATFADATGLVNWQRAVKSTAEIGFMGKAAKIVENMHASIAQKAEPALAKNVLVAEIYRASVTWAAFMNTIRFAA